MTKEELEKEADKWLENNLHSTEEDYKQAYLAGAESREKQIDELEEVRSKQAELINKDTIRMENQKYQIEKLEKENAEMKKQLEMSNKVYNDNLDYCHHIEALLTKAKEIIKKLVNGVRVLNDPAEQFLKECEK